MVLISRLCRRLHYTSCLNKFQDMEDNMMREKLKNDLLMMLDKNISAEELRKIEPRIDLILSNYEVKERETALVPYGSDIPETVEIYIVSKKIAGLSDKSLYLYNLVLTDFFRTVQKKPDEIDANIIRVYLYTYQKNHNISNRTLDCRRTIICTYFAWMAAEGYLPKNPAINIVSIKYERKHKKPMSQLELEKMRSVCITKREKAIVEVLYSTGCRVTELERLNISDVNFETKEVMLYGKGNKHRTAYLNAKAEFTLGEYLAERTDDNPALFVYTKKPYGRLKKSGIELIIKNLLQKTKDVTTHVTPHTYRHTFASVSLDRGMNVVDVSKLLGHAKLETTMEYITKSDDMKMVHGKYVV